jgi:uncharacterized protein (TIGR03790 family)
MRGLARACGWLLWLTWLPAAQAGLAPHEVLVLVNGNSPRSMETANHFVRLRRVPARNVVYLDLPARVLEPRAELTPDEFTRHIWEPAQAELQSRGLEQSVLAWVYSVDFPVRITTMPPVSLMGMTFLRNQIPSDPAVIDQGGYRSPLFMGPDGPEGARGDGASLIHFRAQLDEQYPLPSMILGHAGSRGNRMDTILRTLEYGALADRTAPAGTVHWVTGGDIRAQMRAWQHPAVQEELAQANLAVQLSDHPPQNAPGLIGVQMGRPDVRADTLGRHRPGSMAEHLTSHAAEFHLPIQTKLTAWLRAGATASAGTVTEPYSIWTKFPHVCFFAHYVRGHTMLESFYLSIRSPTQILLVGEPLARPWAVPLMLTVVALEDGPLSGTAAFALATMPVVAEGQLEYQVLVDGEPVAGRSPHHRFSFDTTDLADGYHELRVVSYVRGPLVHSVTGLRGIVVDNHGRAAGWARAGDVDEVDLYRPFQLRAGARGEPERIELVHNQRVLASGEGAAVVFRLDPALLGPGPVTVQARAQYADGMAVYSEPRQLTVVRRSAPPALSALAGRDADGRRTAPDWGGVQPVGGRLEPAGDDGRLFTPNAGERALALFPAAHQGLHSLSARITVPSDHPRHPDKEQAALVFGYRDPDHFQFFMLHGEPAAWSFGRRHNGQLQYAVERGAPLWRGDPHQVDLIFDGGQATAYVDGEAVATWTGPDGMDAGQTGLLARDRAVRFEGVRIEPRAP